MGSPAAGSSSVKTCHHITVLSQHVEPIIIAIAITVGHLLVAGATVHIEKQRIFLCGIKIRRQDNIIIQFRPQRGSQSSKGLMTNAVLCHPCLQISIVLQSFQQLAVACMQGINRRSVRIGKRTDIILARSTETGTVPTFCTTQSFLLFTFKINLVQLFVNRRSLMRQIIYHTLLLINWHYSN